MDESAHRNKASDPPPTPEVAALLKMLEREAAARREQRMPAGNPLQGNAFRYGILIAIVVFAFGSLGLLEWLLSEMPRPVQKTAIEPAALAVPQGKVGAGSPAPAGNAGAGVATPAGKAVTGAAKASGSVSPRD